MFFVSIALAADLRTSLSARDTVACTSLGEPTDSLYAELVAATDPAILPSTVPMRAAGCLVELFGTRADLAAVFTPWMSDADRQGLALLVAARIDELPSSLGVTLATAAMSNPDERARKRIVSRLGESTRPEVRAVVGLH